MLNNNYVWTPAGLQYGKYNSKVGKDEIILNDNDATRVETGVVGKDTENAYVNAEDSILGNDPAMILGTSATFAQLGQPEYEKMKQAEVQQDLLKQSAEQQMKKFDITKSSLAKQTAQFQKKQYDKLNNEFEQIRTQAHDNLKSIADAQAQQHYVLNNTEDVPAYKEGKSSKSSYSITRSSRNIPWLQRAIPDLAALTAGAAQYSWWKRNPIQYHSTYAGNPYERRILQQLASQRYNPYPELRSNQDAERRAAYSNEQSGALSGAQRYLGRIALGLGSQENNAKVLQNAQNQNINLRNTYANAMSTLGAQEAQRRMQANVHDWDDFQAAHGRKVKGIETGMYNMVNALQNWYANEFKYNSWRDSVALYKEELDDNQRKWIAEMQAKYPGWTPNNGATTNTNKGGSTKSGTSTGPVTGTTTTSPKESSAANAPSQAIPSTATAPYVSESITYGPKWSNINYGSGQPYGNTRYGQQNDPRYTRYGGMELWDFGDTMHPFNRKIYDITNKPGGAGGLITPNPRYQYFTKPYPGWVGNWNQQIKLNQQPIMRLSDYPQDFYTHNANDNNIFINDRSYWRNK